MMYHFIFGLRGASVGAAVVPSALAVCGSLVVVAADSFFSSSCIVASSKPAIPSSVALEIIKQVADALLNDVVDHKKVKAKDEHGNHDDGGGSPHFLPRRSGHLAHLGAHVVVKRPDTFRPGPDAIAKVAAGCCK